MAVVAVVAAPKVTRTAWAVLVGIGFSREKSENSEKSSGRRVIIALKKALVQTGIGAA